MARRIGVLATGHFAVGLVEQNKLIGSIHVYPSESATEVLQGMPAEEIAECIREQIRLAAGNQPVEAIGVGVPGVIRNGVIEDSPNLQQMKGLNLLECLSGALAQGGTPVPVRIFNDADAMAAGIAAARGQLDRLVRVWTLGEGIGFGRYPWIEGAWEGGHTVVTLDPKEQFCGCGGKGHLEGVCGHRAMRLRFLDMEPEEIFANAKAGDERCIAFGKLWHRALAAATASAIHMDGPGRFFFTGMNAGFVDIRLLNLYVHEMVKMTPLQGSSLEVISTGDEIGIIGAAVNAARLI